jgi:hypothetical protein
MSIINIIFISTAIWHFLAAYYFMVNPQNILKSHTFEENISPISVDILRFLGAINVGYFATGVIACFTVEKFFYALILMLANLSQFIFDIFAHLSGRWKKRLLVITIGDGIFSLLHIILIVWILNN